MLKSVISFTLGCLFASGGISAQMPSAEVNPHDQYYLALGDSLAFGFQFDIFNKHYPIVPPELFRGYADNFAHLLKRIRPGIQTMNFGCVGETTDTFIAGGCLYRTQGFQLHEHYAGSQLDAATAFLRAYPGQVGTVTFNLGTNDLNTLPALCGDDLACYQQQGQRIAVNLYTILGTLRAAAPDSDILTFTAYNVDPRFLDLTTAFNAIVRTTAATFGVRVADVFAAFNGPPQPETICRLTFTCTSGDSHPTDVGYQVIADELWRASGYIRK
jgi:lysophospholipase L1-like esterase